jgi:ABC-type sugar transport system ATPase subunit
LKHIDLSNRHHVSRIAKAIWRAGRSEVLRAIAGAEPGSSGYLELDGAVLPWPQDVRSAIARGIVMAPEDRKRQGLILTRSALANLVLSDLGAVARGPLIDGKRRRRTDEDLAQRLGFNPARLGADAVRRRSPETGDRQMAAPRAACPAPGRADQGYRPRRHAGDLSGHPRLSDKGMSVILVSSDLEEVVEHSDRVLVMASGRQIAILEAAEATVERILNLIFAVACRPSEGVV